MSKSVMQLLKEMEVEITCERMNLDNKSCSGCGKRHSAKEWKSYEEDGECVVDGILVCPECADQHLRNVTGCGFGTPDKCNDYSHPDCSDWSYKLLNFQTKKEGQ